MSFLDSLEEVRKRPEKERRRLALLWTVAIMVLVIIFWLATFRMIRLPGSAAQKKQGAVDRVFSGFISEVKKGVGVIDDQIKTLKNTGVMETK